MQDGNESKKAGDGDGDERRGNVTKFTTTTMAVSRTFHSFGVASTAVSRQFENASREKTELIIVPHWSNGQSGTLKKFVFASKATLR